MRAQAPERSKRHRPRSSFKPPLRGARTLDEQHPSDRRTLRMFFRCQDSCDPKVVCLRQIRPTQVGRSMYRPSYLLVTQNIRKPLQFYRHLASESRAKSPFDCLSGIANDLVVSRLPANICGSFWDHDDSGGWLSIYDCAGRSASAFRNCTPAETAPGSW